MGTGIEDFVIRFDKPSGVYCAGQKVAGSIQFLATKPQCKSNGVFIRYVGGAEVHWGEEHTTGTGENRRPEIVDYNDYSANEVYFNKTMCLYNPPGRKLQAPYNYSFPFSMQLPMHIPSSFIGSVGKIFYRVEASVHRRSGAWQAAKHVVLPFSVVGIMDLNCFPQLRNPVEMSDQKKFGAFWKSKSKPLTAQLSINKQAFVSGENILVSGVINNESDVKIKECDLKLIRNVQYFARGNKRSDSAVTAYKCKQPGIAKESQANWVNVPVFVPRLPPRLDGCNIITRDYILLIRLVASGMHFDLELTFSITIGTIPFRKRPAPPLPIPEPTGYTPTPSGSGTLTGHSSMRGRSGADLNAPLPEGSNYGYAYAPAPPGLPSGYAAGPSAPYPTSAPEPPPYGDIQPTYGVYLGDSNEPPSYDSLFKGSPNNEDDDDDGAKNYQPKYPSFNIPPQ